MEDPAKIEAILSQLNKGLKQPKWQVAEGFHTMLAIVPDSNGGLNVNASQGVTVKLFLNSETGEVKSYLLRAVQK